MDTPNSGRHGNTARIFFFILMVVAYFCTLYVNDSIAPAAKLLQTQLGFSYAQIGSLNAVFNLPNIVLVILLGVLCDRIGHIKSLVIMMGMVCLGSLLVAISSNYHLMLVGRLIYGIGGEGLVVAEAAAIAFWFRGPWFAFLLALHVAIARLGSYSADMSPTFFPSLYDNWQHPLWLAFAVSAIAFLAAIGCYFITKTHTFKHKNGHLGEHINHNFKWVQLTKFNSSFWYIVLLGVMFYSPLLAFRSAFAIEYFQNAHGLTLQQAGQMNSYVFLAAFICTPLFGWICDKFGRHTMLLAAGMLLTTIGFIMLASGSNDLIIVTVLFGIGYSVIPAVLWPAMSYVVPASLLGTGYGIMNATQNFGQGASSLFGGWLADWGQAGAHNPGGYLPMFWFFVVLCVLGVLAAILLWSKGIKRLQEAKPL